MAGFRDKFIQIFHGVAKLLPTPLLTTVSRQKLIFPFYHTISDQPLPHIRHLYQVKGVKQFEQDLDFLLRHYTPLTYLQLEELILQHKQPTKPSFLLSFDDGLREIHDVVAPVLERKGVPAVCFLNSAFVDNQALFFRYKVSLLLEQYTKHPALFANRQVQDLLQQQTGAKLPVPEALLKTTYAQRNALDELAGLVDVSFHRFLQEQQPYLSSAQVQALQQRGFHFGAHSIDHPEYRLIPYQEQLRQTTESIEQLRTAFDMPYKTFSFPFTDYQVSGQFFDEIYNSGTATLTFGCSGLKHDSHHRNIQRFALERDALGAREILHAELLYYTITALAGKHKINR